MLRTATVRYPHNTIFQTLSLILTEKRSTRSAERQLEQSKTGMIWGIGEMGRLAGGALWKPDGSGAQYVREMFNRAIRTDE